jgi:hypothetical protein
MAELIVHRINAVDEAPTAATEQDSSGHGAAGVREPPERPRWARLTRSARPWSLSAAHWLAVWHSFCGNREPVVSTREQIFGS